MFTAPVLTALAEALTSSSSITVLGDLHTTLVALLAPYDTANAAVTLQRYVSGQHADILAIFCGSNQQVRGAMMVQMRASVILFLAIIQGLTGIALHRQHRPTTLSMSPCPPSHSLSP
jgi:hypothetical protein